MSSVEKKDGQPINPYLLDDDDNDGDLYSMDGNGNVVVTTPMQADVPDNKNQVVSDYFEVIQSSYAYNKVLWAYRDEESLGNNGV